MTPVYCDACEWVHGDTRVETKPWRYRCAKAPTRAGYAFVHPKYSPDPPYQRCQDVNFDGKCAWFEKKIDRSVSEEMQEVRGDVHDPRE